MKEESAVSVCGFLFITGCVASLPFVFVAGHSACVGSFTMIIIQTLSNTQLSHIWGPLGVDVSALISTGNTLPWLMPGALSLPL